MRLKISGAGKGIFRAKKAWSAFFADKREKKKG